MADTLTILSAGAVKPGLTKVIEAFQRDGAIEVRVSFATAPALLEQIGTDEAPDVVIAPTDTLEKLTRSGKCSARETAVLGRIGVGVLVRSSEPSPKIATVADFKRSLLDAEGIVYNQASTGTYLENLFETLSIAPSVKNKTTRYPDFAAVLDHVSKGTCREIGFGATTVIIENQSQGVKFAGTLPEQIQNYTTYVAAAMLDNENAKKFITWLSLPAARSLLTAAGIQ